MTRQKMKLSDFGTGDGESTLQCPNCGSNYLHHGQIDVFNRNEDSENGCHFRVTGNRVELDNQMTANPSSRRQGLTISLSCEGCKAAIFLSLSQHKGITNIWMDYCLS